VNINAAIERSQIAAEYLARKIFAL
jgi:hypothetical protein